MRLEINHGKNFKESTGKYVSGGKDSAVKVVDLYFASIAAEPYTFNGKTYQPKNIRVSPAVMRGFSCFENCGACCRDFTVDFLPEEQEKWQNPNTEARFLNFNGKDILIYTDKNDTGVTDKQGKIRCRNLNIENGRCGIHMKHPLSCDFELLRFVTSNISNKVNLNHQLFGRGWNMKRITGDVGAACVMEDRSEADRQESIRKLLRLKEWTDHFGLKTVLPQIISWLNSIPLNETKPLVIIQEGRLDSFLAE